jgi:glycosyltransferase involved in cell wall biosynthesis
MRLGIDASNLRVGGGVRHLVELLRAADPGASGFSEVYVWSGRQTLDQIEDRNWLIKAHQPLLDGSLPFRSFWQRFHLSARARSARCDLVLIPGGSYTGDFHPTVTMSRNMLPFLWEEMRRYAWSLVGLRLLMLRWLHSRTFRRADGVIFLTEYARDAVMRVIKNASGAIAIIPHGIDRHLLRPPRIQHGIDQYSKDIPFRMVYVSIVDQYKHQSELAEAVGLLRARGLPVALELIGPAYGPSLNRLRKTLQRVDPRGEFVRYRGAVPYAELSSVYAKADLCVFASSCENMPNILLEGMASGLPVACSNRGPMPQVLGDAGAYFDPENPKDIARALSDLINSPELRARLSAASSERVNVYSWERCAGETFEFLAKVADARGATTSPTEHR